MNEHLARVVDETPPPPDDKAQAEAADISRGTLKRDESLRAHFHIGGLVCFWFAVLAVIAITGTWLFNLLTPDKYHFLSDPEKLQLQNLLITALGSSLLTDYGKRIVNRLDK